MTEEIDWIALESLAMAQEARDDSAEERYRVEGECLCKELARWLRDGAEEKRLEGDYAGAEALCRQALEIVEKQFGPDGMWVARVLGDLARLLWDGKGDLVAAEKLFRRALAILEKQGGPDHPNVAFGLICVALVLKDQGEYAAAEPLYRRALSIKEKELGLDHPAVAYPLFRLAEVLARQAEYAAAEPLYRRALAIAEKDPGSGLMVAWLKSALVQCVDANAELVRAESLAEEAELLEERGDVDASEALYLRALAIRETLLGLDHLDVAKTLTYLAGMFWSYGYDEEAEPLYRRALAINEKHLGSEHPDVIHIVSRLGGGG
jgi:tetratricopeptide (TPR) repeat protein